MSGLSRCKNFLRNLDIEQLKKIKVRIKRENIPEPDYFQPIYRGLDDPKSLVVHFRREAVRGIFDREDIVVNQEFSSEENSSKLRSRSRSCDSRNNSRDEKFVRGESISRDKKYEDSTHKSRGNERSYRSRSRGKYRTELSRYKRDRSRSHSPRKRSSSSHRTAYKGVSYNSGRRSRSTSLSPVPIKKPGLYIPPKSDYLRYEKRRSQKSQSPGPSYSGTHKDKVYSSKSPSRYKCSTSSHSKHKSPEPDYSHRRSKSPGRSRTPHRRSRSPTKRLHRSRSPRRSKDYRSRRSRSGSRHRDRNLEDIDYYGNVNISPFIFEDGQYWIPAGPVPPSGFIPRGYLPPPLLYPRGFHPPMLMPRMPMRMMQPNRQRQFRPKIQPAATNTATTIVTEKIQNKDEKNEEKGSTINKLDVQQVEKHAEKEPEGVVITEMTSEGSFF
ncbi:hypothetical protein HHI36_015551 [Cryptolaemus montrouzieri]|uniref:Uncharacterized protein n=1 Tax=Cryptolaemus montrouzieri TaxID=559131 RepID=A0ABD2N6T4_9CUCU